MTTVTYKHYMDALKSAALELSSFDGMAVTVKDWSGMPVALSPKAKAVFFFSNSAKDGGQPVGAPFAWTGRDTIKTGMVYVRAQKCDVCDTYDAGFQQYTPNRIGDTPVTTVSTVSGTDDSVVRTNNTASTDDGCYAAWYVARGRIVIAKAVAYHTAYAKKPSQDLSGWLD